MLNKYGTKSYKEIKIKDYPAFNKCFLETAFGLDSTNIRNKKILVLNLDPLAVSLAFDDNDITAISTSNVNRNSYLTKYCNVKSYYAKDITKLEEILCTIKKNSMDYIFTNPPYDKTLYLEISQVLLPYLNDKGSLVVFGPMMPISIPFEHRSKYLYSDLWKHLHSFSKIEEKYYNTFESFIGYTELGIMTFKQETNFYNIHKLWKKYRDNDEVRLYEKILSYKGPKMSDVVGKNLSNGTILPLAGIAGYSKKYPVYDSIMYVDNGQCFVKENDEYFLKPLSKYEGFGVSNGKVSCGICVRNVNEAVTLYKKYRSNLIIRGLFAMSLGGSQHPHWKFMPYISYDEIEQGVDLVDKFKLTKEDIAVLTKHATNDTLETRYSHEANFNISKPVF
ncbi:MAG: hypothetical protein J6T10_13325 [Methanobrevibacter sp.]|nr:hypothetical protein [Methanobrevibacter sp.]